MLATLVDTVEACELEMESFENLSFLDSDSESGGSDGETSEKEDNYMGSSDPKTSN